MPSPSSLHTLTFGVKIEFSLAYTELDERPSTIRDTYIRHPLVVAGTNVSPRSHATDEGTDVAKYAAWHVSCDSTVETTFADLEAIDWTFANGVVEGDNMEYIGVEVISPTLPLTVNELKEVERALEVLRTQCVFAPRSAGLHVHIGNKSYGFSLPLLSKI